MRIFDPVTGEAKVGVSVPPTLEIVVMNGTGRFDPRPDNCRSPRWSRQKAPDAVPRHQPPTRAGLQGPNTLHATKLDALQSPDEIGISLAWRAKLAENRAHSSSSRMSLGGASVAEGVCGRTGICLKLAVSDFSLRGAVSRTGRGIAGDLSVFRVRNQIAFGGVIYQ